MLHIPGKLSKGTESFFSVEREQKFVFLHFERVFLLRFGHQIEVTKRTNDEVFKTTRDHQRTIEMSRNSSKEF